MDDKQLQDLLNGMDIPAPDEAKKTYALNAAESAFAANLQKNAKNRQGSSSGARLTDVIRNILGDLTMKKAYIAVGSVAFAALAISLVTSTALVKPDFLATPTNDPAVVQPEVKKDSSVEQLAASPAPQAEMAKSKPMEGGVAAGASMDMAANRGVVGGASLSMSRHAEPFYQQQQQYFGDDQFEKTSENPIKLTLQEPVSTFSIDVDTASYSFVRSALNRGVLPPKDSVRVEELINYFDYNYETPATKEEPFKPTVAIYETPWNKDTLLLHVGIKGHDLDKKAAAPRSNLTFLIDTSGSMNDPQKLPLLIQAFTMLVDTLNPDDTIAIVTYAGSAGTVLEPTKVSDKSKIMTALQNLGAGGSTAGGEGILQAYVLAESTFNKGGVNRVILATDGDFNVGITDREQLKDLVERKRDTGIYLSVLGFGRGNYNDALMQTLAQNATAMRLISTPSTKHAKCWSMKPPRHCIRLPTT